MSWIVWVNIFSQWHIILQQMTMASDINGYPAIPCNDLQILYVSWEMPGYVLGWHPAVMKYSWTSNAWDGSKWMNWFPCGCKQNILPHQ